MRSLNRVGFCLDSGVHFSFGGFLARKGDGEPGVKTIWLGLQRIVDFAAGIRFAREAHVL